MELVSAYLYNSSPFETKGISSITFHNLKRSNWFKDIRSNQKHQIFSKRFKINEKWYRTIIRFTQTGDTYELDVPLPFIVAETEAQDEDETVFKDTKVIHGRKVGNTIGYLEVGVPVELIDAVLFDLKSTAEYKETMAVTVEEISLDTKTPTGWEF